METSLAPDVGQRTQELGIRVALGAQASDIVGIVVGQGVRFALVGFAAGTVIALAAARWFQPLLFHQSARDPVVYAVIGFTLLIVAIAASAVPARRAAGADPNIALRADQRESTKLPAQAYSSMLGRVIAIVSKLGALLFQHARSFEGQALTRPTRELWA